MASLNQPLRVMHIISGDLWAGAEVQAYTLLKHLNSQCTLTVICLNDGDLSCRLSRLNIPIEVIPEVELNALQILIRINRAIRKFNPDIVHTHRQKENILGAIANLLAHPKPNKRAKCLRTAHGAPEHTAKGLQRIQVALDRWVANHLQCGIIAVSQELGQLLKKNYPAKEIHVIHNGVDIDELLKIEPTHFDSGKSKAPVHVGIVGRLGQIKRIDLFIKAAKILLSERNFAGVFHIIGDGKLRQELETLSQSLEIETSVKFHGHQTEVHSFIKALDILVICSDHEGTPMVVLEACALGTRVVAHYTGGLPEIISADQGHHFSQEHTPLGYANAIEDAILDTKPVLPLEAKLTAQHNALTIYNLYASKSKNFAELTSSQCI